jgi:hypothetical protein
MPIILAEALVTFYLLLLKPGLISTNVQNGVIKSPGYSSTLYPNLFGWSKKRAPDCSRAFSITLAPLFSIPITVSLIAPAAVTRAGHP